MDFNKLISWNKGLNCDVTGKKLSNLASFLSDEYSSHVIFPPEDQLFTAFELTPFDTVKVVIIGQDPYHEQGQAHGLCFSVNDNVKIPPSLRNIYSELQRDLAIDPPESGNLTHWAKQGVLLLNNVLTVREGQAASHQNKGWEWVTDRVIELLNSQKEGVVYMLWGGHAQKKGAKIDKKRNCVLLSSHPSPLSVYRGFKGCSHFSMANEYLRERGELEIFW